MAIYLVEKSVPIVITIEADDEESALAYTDDKWRGIWNAIESAVDGTTLPGGGQVEMAMPYDDINVEMAL